MASPSSTGSNSPNNDSNSPSIGNAPPMALNPIPPFPHFTIFSLPPPPNIFLPKVREAQPWEEGDEEEEEEEEDYEFEDLQAWVKEDAEDHSYYAFMGELQRQMRRCRGSRTSFDSSIEASNSSSGFSSETNELDSSEVLDFGAGEWDLGPNLSQEGFDKNTDTYRHLSP